MNMLRNVQINFHLVIAFYIVIFQWIYQDAYGIQESTVVTDKEKKALRYGFHQVQQCNNFEKAFICIRKCLDLRFDVAYSDKDCYCTCYTKKEKGKYRYIGAVTEWKLGAPTTKIPAWALPDNTHMKDHLEDDATTDKSDDQKSKQDNDKDSTSPQDLDSPQDSGKDTNTTDAASVNANNNGNNATESMGTENGTDATISVTATDKITTTTSE